MPGGKRKLIQVLDKFPPFVDDYMAAFLESKAFDLGKIGRVVLFMIINKVQKSVFSLSDDCSIKTFCLQCLCRKGSDMAPTHHDQGIWKLFLDILGDFFYHAEHWG